MNLSLSTPILETEHLILRKFVQSDATSVFDNWASDEEIQKAYLEPTYSTLEDVESLLSKYIASYVTKPYFRWAVISKETNTCIGQIAFFLIDIHNNLAEIEYCIGKAFQNKGYCTEAVNAVTRFGFITLELHRIQICTSEGNFASMRVITKCHYKFEGMLRGFFYIDGQYKGRLYYSLLKDEYLSEVVNS